MAVIKITIFLSVLAVAFLAENTMAHKCPLSAESFATYDDCIKSTKEGCDAFALFLNPDCLTEEEMQEVKFCYGKEKEMLDDNYVYSHEKTEEEINLPAYNTVRDEVTELAAECEKDKDFESQGKEIYTCFIEGVGKICKD